VQTTKFSMKIIPEILLEDYIKNFPQGLEEKFHALHDAEISNDSFSFYTSVSVMASSKIEGEALGIDSYVKYKMLNVEYLNDLVEKPNDLYKAYIFAQNNKLSLSSFFKAHEIISEHLLLEAKRGIYRNCNMVLMEHKTFKIQYEAALSYDVAPLMRLFWDDLEYLIDKNLTFSEIFYYASFIHINFVNIHPFEDCNGRSGRLLEKWFLSEKLGEKAWFIQSELNYYRNVNDYYLNLNRLGLFYDSLDYSKAMPFLQMLPQSLFL
jgi:Fic family protein